jgi:hypothetical protein
MVRTNSLTTTACVLLASALLQACGQAPLAVAPLAVAPVLRIDDARAMLAQQRAASALPRQSAPTPMSPISPISPAEQRATLPVTPSRMEIVQLGPNEYRLQYRQPAAATIAAATLTAARLPATTSPVDAAPLQIVNGNGVRGMGERVRALLARQGIAASRVVNQRGHYQRTTIIEYLPGQQQRAADVQTALNGHAVLLPARALPDGLALRLVLGRDHSARLSALAAPAVRLPAVAPLLSALDAPALPSFNQE